MRIYITLLTNRIFTICFCLLLAALTGEAATMTVTKTADTNDGFCNADCSLREAIAAATSGDTIVFASPLFDTLQFIQLSTDSNFQTLVINKNLNIVGNGADLLTIRRPSSAPNSIRYRVFQITNATVNFSGLTIANGFTNGNGAGINADNSTLTLTNCQINGNTAAGLGGGIYSGNGGALNIINSVISNNRSDLSSSGGGGGGIHSSNNLTLTNSTVSGNVKNNGDSNGGGVWASGTAIITNSTVANNRAPGANSAGGVFRASGAAVTVRSSIIAANQNNTSIPDVNSVAAFNSGGYNLIGSAPAGIGFSDGANQDKVGTFSSPLNPRLDPLGIYSGTTQTHRLQTDSPALDAGSSFGLTADQRGQQRPTDIPGVANASDGADIGAFELEVFLTVTKVEDTNDGVCDADCSLREAIALAGTGNVITFSSLFNTAQTITLSEAAGFRTLTINKNLTIIGKGANLLIVRRDPAASVNFRIFTIDNSANIVNLSGMTITGGKIITNVTGGGGISFSNSQGSLIVTDCYIHGNSATSAIAAGGGGIGSLGTLIVRNSTVSNNTLDFGSAGNSGSNGGGIFVLTGAGTFELTNSTVSGNVVTGARPTSGNGGGVYASSLSNLISNSTVTDNETAGTASAGGIYANQATTIRSTIAAANRNSTTVPDFAVSGDTFNSGGFNLIGNAGTAIGFNSTNDQTGTSSVPINPLLQPLGNYGGATPTHALMIGSPALDAGNSFNLTTDQRGQPRPTDNPAAPPAPGGDESDIGAFEAALFAPLVVTKIEDTNDGACDADCSLREAIAAAGARGSEIVFSSLFDSAQIITLSDAAGFGSLAFDKSLNITGKGANLLTIRRDSTSSASFPVFSISNSSVGIAVSLSGMSITGGRAVSIAPAGGGINFNSPEGSLTIAGSHIYGNHAVGANVYKAGGILSNGALTLRNSTVSNNSVTAGSGSISDSGGGICLRNGSVEFVMTNSTVSGNVLSSSVAGSNNAGGIFIEVSASGRISLISNSTVTDNAAIGAGSGSGIFTSAATTIRSTIVAGNRNNTTVPDISKTSIGAFNSQGYNLIGNAPAGIGITDTVNNDRAGTGSSPLDPRLDPLGNYGGATPTHRLQSNSPAIDKGNSFTLIIDQRSFARTVDVNAISNLADGTDVGAYEFQALAPTAATVMVGGRVLTPDGSGLRNALVTLTDMNGNKRTVLTGARGAFRFSEVTAGRSYIISVNSKRYSFQPRVLIVNEDITDLNFTGALLMQQQSEILVERNN